MSQPTEREKRGASRRAALFGRVRELYHIPVLALLLVFMLWNRVRTWENFTVGDRILYRGNDAWYHFRQTSYTVENWPFTMPFDPWTHFPVGTASGQFGTLFDQLIATAALVLGLFMPQGEATALALLFAPAVFGTLVAVPGYFLGRRFGGRAGGVVAVLVLALTPGAFLFRSLVGFSDHHIAEVFFQVTAVLAVMVAVTVAERERPVFEQFTARETGALWRPVGYAALAGVALGLYIWVWPPGIFFVSVLGLFFLVHLLVTFLRGHSPEHVAISGVVTLGVAALLSALRISTFEFTASDFSLLQPVLFLLLAAGLVVMAALARTIERRDDAAYAYPGVVLGAIVVGAVLFAVALPDLFDYFVRQFLRIYGLDAGAATRTVREAQPIPLDEASSRFFRSYGLAFFAAAVGSLILLARYLLSDRPRGQSLLLVVWAVMMVLATLTQNRFEYYLAAPVAALTAYLVGYVVRLADLRAVRSTADIDAWQAMTVGAVLLVVVAPFVAVTGPINFDQEDGGVTADSIRAAERNGPGSDIRGWEGSLQWLSENTPEEGRYADPGGETVEYYGTHEQTEDFDYPAGAYGVMSWWDYGHFITVEGQRIPDANPFQQGTTRAANFLLATNETGANEIVARGNETTRYVMIDWKLAEPRSNKYSAPAAFDERGVSYGDLIAQGIYTQRFGQPRLTRYVRSQQHYESMRVRLYQFHGSARDPTLPNGQVVVVDWERRAMNFRGQQTRPLPTAPENGSLYRTFDTMEEAEAFVQQDGSAQIGGAPGVPTERVEALEHYRLVHASDRARQGVGQWVKTFERVPGATVEGTGPANATVTARVRMEMPNANQTFTYVQRAETDADGRFTMTLPYSTTGYEEWGTDEGYTDVNVRAAGPYEFRATQTDGDAVTVYNASTDVSEGTVIGEDDGAVTVELEQSAVFESGDAPNGSTNDTGAAPAGNGTESETNTTSDADGSNETNGSDAGSIGARGSTLASARIADVPLQGRLSPR